MEMNNRLNPPMNQPHSTRTSTIDALAQIAKRLAEPVISSFRPRAYDECIENTGGKTMLLLEITLVLTAGFAIWVKATFKPVEISSEPVQSGVTTPNSDRQSRPQAQAQAQAQC